jgi:hypothetical protein
MGAGPALHLTPLCNQYLLLEISRWWDNHPQSF